MLNNATLPYVMRLANKGYKAALRDDKHFCDGLNVCRGLITNPDVADALQKKYVRAAEILT